MTRDNRGRGCAWFQPWAGMLLIACVYIYFLIFAQFAFLRLAEASGVITNHLRWVMGIMGGCGIIVSVGSGYLISARNRRPLLLCGLVGSSGVALGALVAQGWWFFLVAGLIGFFLALMTVSLMANLPDLLGAPPWGWWVGWGTGLAYAMCNLPAIFGGSAEHQTILAAIVCGLGGGLLCGLPVTSSETATAPAVDGTERDDRWASLVVAFLALVWLDSAAFYILQTTPQLNQLGWGSQTLQWQNAGIHLLGALGAGWALDRYRLGSVLYGALFALGLAALFISFHTAGGGVTHAFYALGVSLYSTALVYAPLSTALTGSSQKLAPRAGWLYGVSGWLGSALGIGLAQDLHVIPRWFIVLAVLVVLVSLTWKKDCDWRKIFLAKVWWIGLAALGCIVVFTSGHQQQPWLRAPEPESSVELGREVYIAEGCLHCHSQYVRPGTYDEEWWGPVCEATDVLAEEPPLIGNRRQGPDLMNIGNRRSAAWNRLHLMNPRALSPQSSMPRYAYLFGANNPRGPALVAYLSQRGAETFEARNLFRNRWKPQPQTVPIAIMQQQQLFQMSCAPCHGAEGLGNGILAAPLGGTPPRNLQKGQWIFIPKKVERDEQRTELARVIKFGVTATSMPGHEYWSDAQVLGLADYVQSLHSEHVAP